MNERFDQHDDLERELRDLRPAKLTEERMSQLESALIDDASVVGFPTANDRSPTRMWFLRGAALAACAALLLSFIARHSSEPPPNEARPADLTSTETIAPR